MEGWGRIRARRTVIVATAVVGCIVPACTPWSTDVEEFADPAAQLREEVDLNLIPSLAAMVVKDDSIVWEEYYGYADVASQRPADRATAYVLASVSKLVVVTAAMQLYERGVLDLHADVSDYLPFLVRNPHYPDEPITAYHLLTHTSGLAWPESEAPGYWRKYPVDDSPPLSDWIPEFLLPQGAHYAPAIWRDSRPGERESYSNTGVALLAYIVEIISGIDYNEYCKRNIFEPLGMASTSHAYADLDLNHVAIPYLDLQHPIELYRYRDYPAGDLKSTVTDFSRLLIAYMNGGRYGDSRVLDAATVAEILEPRNPASGISLIWAKTLGNWYGHSGGKDGVSAYVEFQPDSRVALIVVANRRHPAVYPGGRIHALVRRIAERIRGMPGA